MIARRGFLHAILAAGMAPAVVRASSLMKIVVPSTAILMPIDFERDFIHQHIKDVEEAIFNSQYGHPEERLMQGEIGRYETMRFVESPYMPPKINAWRSGYLAKRFGVGRWG